MGPQPSFVQIVLCLQVIAICVASLGLPGSNGPVPGPVAAPAARLKPRHLGKLAPKVFILNAVRILLDSIILITKY